MRLPFVRMRRGRTVFVRRDGAEVRLRRARGVIRSIVRLDRSPEGVTDQDHPVSVHNDHLGSVELAEDIRRQHVGGRPLRDDRAVHADEAG